MEKRYAIVEVRYDNCPIKYMIPKTYKNRCILDNKNCEQCGRNGDTKEQLVVKVLQAINITKQKIKDGKYNFVTYKGLAEIIVEFLGVKNEKENK